jgi:hypothetical protein
MPADIYRCCRHYTPRQILNYIMITKSLWSTAGKGSDFSLCLLNKNKLLVCVILHWGYSSMNIRTEWEIFAVAWYSDSWLKGCWNFTSHRSGIQDEVLVVGCVVVLVPAMASHSHTGPALQNTSVIQTIKVF